MKRKTKPYGGADLHTLKQYLREQTQVPARFHERHFDLLIEVEALLTLYHHLLPEADNQARHPGNRPAELAWSLVSGYFVEGVNNTETGRRACLHLRRRLQYLKTRSAWQYWLRWYRQLPQTLRLYTFTPLDERTHHFAQQTYGVALRAERLAAYEALWTETLPFSTARLRFPVASAGQYTFHVDKVPHNLTLSEAFVGGATHLAASAVTDILRQPRERYETIQIHFDELADVARELDDKENSLGLRAEQKGDWAKRFTMRLALLDAQAGLSEAHTIEISRLFHLVGALGVGKSTLIALLTYLLATRRGLHVTVIMNTVVETVRFAAWLRQMGVAAAPALGRDRAEHRRKYGLANADTLRMETILATSGEAPDDPTLDPALRWMPSPCALSGLGANSIPVGKEPCESLLDHEEKRHTCPLLRICPVHQTAHDLAQSQVWVVNAMSLLYSRVPHTIKTESGTLFEAVYRTSDLLIIDEADRVQVQWDRAFAPTQPLAGSEDAMLDGVHRRLAVMSSGARGRRRAADSEFHRLTNIDAQASILANRVFRLLTQWPKLRAWVSKQPLENRALFTRLSDDMLKLLPKRTRTDQVRVNALHESLFNTFRLYWQNPLNREQGELADWLNLLLATDTRDEQTLRRRLRIWLTMQLGWKRKQLDPKQNLLLRKLDFALTFSAMLKRANDMRYQLGWVTDDLRDLRDSRYGISEDVLSAIPDSPLGRLLGARLMGAGKTEANGVFHTLKYQGVGRWLLYNFHHVLQDQHRVAGPHVLLTSATSWLPGSPQYHLTVAPHGVLLPAPSDAVSKVTMRYLPVLGNNRAAAPLSVSGGGDQREQNLAHIVEQLAANRGAKPSLLQGELDSWLRQGSPRRVLLVVNSYAQVQLVYEALARIDVWANRAAMLLPDEKELADEANRDVQGDVNHLRRGAVEQFSTRDAEILIAPLMAIQRGFNILDEVGGALIGSVYFLVRPVPPGDDLTAHVYSMNAWLMGQLADGAHLLGGQFGQNGLEGVARLRRHANQRWQIHLATAGRGIQGMSKRMYHEYVCDTFIPIWQTIGRLLRGQRDAHVFFVDAAFAQPVRQQTLLASWNTLLHELTQNGTEANRGMADALYSIAAEAFRRAFANREME